MRFVCDATWRWVGDHAVMAGSPHRLFRLTPAGAQVARRLEVGEDVAKSALVDRLLDAGAIHPAPLTGIDAAVSRIADVTVVTPQFGGVAARDGRITVDDASEPPLDGASVRLHANVGPAGARNAGRRTVDTPFVFFVDDDVDVPELDPVHQDHGAWWAALLRHFDDPRVGLVAPRVTGDDGSSLDLGLEPGRVRAGTRISYAPGAALLVRVEAFDDVGGFDPSLRLGEDVDLVWRLDQAGWWCRYEPAATVHHRPRPTFVEQLRQQVKYGSSSGPLALRHPGALAPYASGLWTAASWGMVGAGRYVTGAVLAIGSAARLATANGSSDLDARTVGAVALDGHVAAGRQAQLAIRRAWWPFLVPLLWSRRARRVLTVAMIASPRRVLKDVAFSIGLWRSSIATRSFGPIVPQISLGRRGSGRTRRSVR